MLNSLIQALVGLASAALGLAALTGRPLITRTTRAPRFVRWIWGGLMTLGALGMIAGIKVPFFTFFAASLLALLVVGALLAPRASSAPRRTRPSLGALLLGVLAVGALQPLGLKVLALPKADPLPEALVSEARVVKTYGPGMWFEGIAAAPDGTLYLAENRGENYATGDKSQVEGEVIARQPDGQERVFFAPPKGSTVGVLTLAQDGTVYMAGTGGNLGIWKIDPQGQGRLFAPMPKGAWPNGVTMGPDGQVYVADSNLGTIWRVEPQTGAVSTAYEGPVLRARRYIALPPGANGLHFHGRDLFVTVSDSGKLLKFHLGEDGHLEEPTVAASGIPADDFAIDADGTIYLTTHIYNALVRVAPDGRRTVIAKADQGISGATDCVFGTAGGDRSTLYVVTDGGALASGDPDARGTLVAIRLAGH